MNTFWLIIFILFLVAKAAGKSRPAKQKTLNRQPWDEIRRMQQMWFPEESTAPAKAALPGGPELDPEGISMESRDWAVELPEAAAGEVTRNDLLPNQIDLIPGVSPAVVPVMQDASPDNSQMECGNFEMIWRPNTILQGIILAEILKPPGGINRRRR